MKLTMPQTPCQTLIETVFAKIKEHPETPNAVRTIYAARKVFPPRKNINKFIAGGVVEEVMADLIRKCGEMCTNVSSTETTIDIVVYRDTETFPISLKSIQKLGTAIVLENYRGQRRAISELPPTILVILGETTLTLAYLDNDLILQSGVPQESVYAHADSNLSMKGRFAKEMVTRTLPRTFVIDIPVPPIPDLEEEDIAVLAVRRVRELLGI